MDNPLTEEEIRMLLVLDEWEKTNEVEDDYSNLMCWSYSPNEIESGVSELRRSVLKDIMEALTDPGIIMIGVCGNDDNHVTSLFQRVTRRGLRDSLFGMIVIVSIGENPDLRRIQDEIAFQISFSFQGQEKQDKTAACCCGHYFQFHSINDNNQNVLTENARQLSDKIRTVQKILFILRDLRSQLDLAKLGIPFGDDHQGCKLILTSESEDLLSNRMNVQHTLKFRSLPY